MSHDLYIWATILALALATVLARASFFMLSKVKLPTRLQHGLRFAPAAALAAIVVPDLVFANGQLSIALSNPKLMGGLAATVFFLLTRSVLGTIVFGMAAYSVLRVMLT